MTIETLLLAHDGGSPGAPLYTAEHLRLPYLDYTKGVLDGFEVTERAAGANTSVDVAGGIAVTEGPADFGSTTHYRVEDDTGGNTGSIGSAPGSNYRNDIVGLLTRDPDAPGSGDTDRDTIFHVVTGAGHTPATAPGAAYGASGDPTLPDRFEPLARVRWSAGMVSITDAQIDDLRSWATLSRDVIDDANATRLGTHLGVPDTICRRTTVDGQVAVGTPTSSAYAANKAYVDAAVAAAGTIFGTPDTVVRRTTVDGRINVGTPTETTNAANKAYVDAGDAALDPPWTALGSAPNRVFYRKIGTTVYVYGNPPTSGLSMPSNHWPVDMHYRPAYGVGGAGMVLISSVNGAISTLATNANGFSTFYEAA